MTHKLQIPKGTLIIRGLTREQFTKLEELFERFTDYMTVITMFGYEIEIEFYIDKEAQSGGQVIQ